MSQETNCTNLNEELDDRLFTQYYDEIFRQFPLPINLEIQKEEDISDFQIVQMKIKWIIEYFVHHIKYKAKIKEMLGNILDMSEGARNRE